MLKVDPIKTLINIVFFDGGSNMQLAGSIIQDVFPRISVAHGMEHVLNLMFKDISKIKIVQVRDLEYSFFCNHAGYNNEQYT